MNRKIAYPKLGTAHTKSPHWLAQQLTCFENPFIVVLVTLAIIQHIASPDGPKPIIISVMVAIGVGLQFSQKYRSGLAPEKLKALVEVAIQEFVPGDVVEWPADALSLGPKHIQSRDGAKREYVQ